MAKNETTNAEDKRPMDRRGALKTLTWGALAIGTLGVVGKEVQDSHQRVKESEVPLPEQDWLYVGMISPSGDAEPVRERYNLNVSPNGVNLSSKTAAQELREEKAAYFGLGKFMVSDRGRTYDTVLVGHNTGRIEIPQDCKTVLIPQSALAEIDQVTLDQYSLSPNIPNSPREIQLKLRNKDEPDQPTLALAFGEKQKLPDILVYNYDALGPTFHLVAGMKAEKLEKTLAESKSVAVNAEQAPGDPAEIQEPPRNPEPVLVAQSDASGLMIEKYRTARRTNEIPPTHLTPPVFMPNEEGSARRLTKLVRNALDPIRREEALDSGIVLEPRQQDTTRGAGR